MNEPYDLIYALEHAAEIIGECSGSLVDNPEQRRAANIEASRRIQRMADRLRRTYKVTDDEVRTRRDAARPAGACGPD